MFCRDLRKVSMVTVGSLLTMYSSKVFVGLWKGRVCVDNFKSCRSVCFAYYNKLRGVDVALQIE